MVSSRPILRPAREPPLLNQIQQPMGQSLVQRIVEDHDGTVTAGNRLVGGAVFTVFLPSAELLEVEARAGQP